MSSKFRCSFYKYQVENNCQASLNMTYEVFVTFCLAMPNQKLKIEEGIIDVNKYILFFCPVFK